MADLRARLLAASAGLLYLSEGESPFTWCEAPWPAGRAVDPGGVAGAFGEADYARTMRVEDFLAGHTTASDPEDDAAQALRPRYDALVAVINASLEAPAVYLFGDVAKRCYIVGLAGDHIVGLRTVAFET